MMDKLISSQQVRVLEVFAEQPRHWFDSNTVADKTNIPSSTVRHLLLMFFKFEVLERTDTFDGYKYRLSPTAEEEPYFRRVQEVAAVMQQ